MILIEGDNPDSEEAVAERLQMVGDHTDFSNIRDRRAVPRILPVYRPILR